MDGAQCGLVDADCIVRLGLRRHNHVPNEILGDHLKFILMDYITNTTRHGMSSLYIRGVQIIVILGNSISLSSHVLNLARINIEFIVCTNHHLDFDVLFLIKYSKKSCFVI